MSVRGQIQVHMHECGAFDKGLGSLALWGRGLIARSGYWLEVGTPSLGFGGTRIGAVLMHSA
jgi:hypothetical protein